jgi:hypothetical protein
MVAFLTSREMFYDYQEHVNCEKDEYENRMLSFDKEAIEAFKKDIKCDDFSIDTYALCISYAFLDGCGHARNLFKKLGLRTIHAYAIHQSLNDFIQEYDEKERNEE